MFTVHRVTVALAVVVVGCGSDELFSVEGFSNSVAIEMASTATFHRDGHDVESVRIIGDIDGDGIADAVVTTNEFDQVHGTWSTAHLVYGGANGDVDLDSLPTLVPDADSPIRTSFLLPLTIAPLGDIDGDGLADFAVVRTSETHCDGGYIIYGNRVRLAGAVSLAGIGVTIQDSVLCTNAVVQFGGLGDIDGDGIDDFGIVDGSNAEPVTDSKTYVFYGRHDRLSGVVDITTADAVLDQVGDEELDSVVSIGDLDGDGRPEFAVRTHTFTPEAFGARIIYSSATRFAGSIAIDTPPATLIPSASCPPTLSALGDFDGDGLADMAVLHCEFGDPVDDTPGPPGTQYIFYGRTGRFGAVLDVATADATIGTAPDSFDSALATGDADGDGIRDLVMTDPGVRDHAGAVYVMPGTGVRLAGEVDLGPTSTAFIGHEVRVTCFNGGDGCTSGQFVGAVFDAGDLTGDGLLDTLVTAPTWDTFPGDAMGARAYLVSPASIP